MATQSQIKTNQILTYASLEKWQNNLVIGKHLTNYDESFGVTPKLGQILNIRRPILTKSVFNDLTYRADSNKLSGMIDTWVQMAVGTTITNSFTFSEFDKALRLENITKRYIEPAVSEMANKVEDSLSDVFSNAGKNTINSTVLSANGFTSSNVMPGVAGWTHESAASGTLTVSDVLDASVYLDEMGCPVDGRILILSPTAKNSISKYLTTIANATFDTGKVIEKNAFGEIAGAMSYWSQVLRSHVNGAQATLVIDDTPAEKTNEIFDPENGDASWAETATLKVTALTGAIKSGDVFVSTVYAVNPVTKSITSALQQFTVVADAGVGATAVLVSPAPIISGPYQNISATIADTTLTLKGSVSTSYKESYLYHPEAVVFASPELSADNVKCMYEKDKDTGLGIRYGRDFDMLGVRGGSSVASGWVHRLDVAYGVKVVRPEWMVRIRIRP